MPSRIWQAWLPHDIAQSAQNEEPGRFAALSRCVCVEVEAILRDDADPNRWHRLVKWLSHVNTFNNLHQDFPAEHVVLLAEALWRSVAESWRDLEAQVRISECLTKLLRTHKRTLRRARLRLPWRPLFAVLQRLHGLPLPKLEGVGLIMARGTALVKLVSKARRFFEPSALGEVWSELRPAILAVERRPSEGYEALGYMQLFAPTHDLCRCNSSALNGWLVEWFSAWDGVANGPSWDSLWLALLARAAKHDWRGVLNWQPHLPHIFASLTGFFDVPIGTSRGVSDIITRGAPGRASILFGEQMGYGSFHAARLVVHLLRCTADSQRGPPTAASASAAAAHLEHLTSLLEQYYHPSNTGKWCRDLGTLLKHLVKAAVKQLERQQPPPPPPRPPSSDVSASDAAVATTTDAKMGHDDNGDTVDEFADYEFELLQLDGGGEGGQGSPTGIAVATGSSRPWVSELREPELQRLASCCVTLAARAQFSKDSSIATVSIKALSQLALVAPGRVLPLVLERFRTALATATATHQLVAATTTLALCIRPLLLAGWAAGGEGEGEERETAAQLVSEALTAALPGLDANDEPKTNAVLQLYVSVISALPRLRGAGEEDETDEVAAAEEKDEHSFARAAQPVESAGTAPAVAPMDIDATATASSTAATASGGIGGELTLSIYVAEWAEEVLERCLALLQNLDSGPGHRGTDMASRGGGSGASTSSFLTMARSLFGPMWELLLHQTRPSVRRRLVQHLSRFVLGGAAPGVAIEVATIASHAASAAPRETLRSLVMPLITRLEEEVEELPRLAATPAAAPPPAPSAGREATLRYQLTILIESLNQLHADHILTPNLHVELRLGPAAAAPAPPSSGDDGVSVFPPGSLASRAMALADKLLGVNSLVLQEEAATLGAVVVMSLPRYWLDPHLPWLRPAGHPKSVPLVPGRGVELWVDKFGTGYQPPRWLSPSPGYVALANKLMNLRLLEPAQRLRTLLTGGPGITTPGGDGGGSGCGDSGGGDSKLRVRGELLKIRGLLLHALSMLRDFQFGEGANGDGAGSSSSGGADDGGNGVPLAVFGSLGVTVGVPLIREQLAEALVDVCSALGCSGDPELLALAARCGGVLLAAGSLEYGGLVDERSQRATSHVHSDAPAATRVIAESGTSSAPLVWRRRLPPWLVQARLFNQLMSRSAAAAFRSSAWCTARQPELTRLEQFPVAYLSLLRTQCMLALHPHTQLARNAAAAVDVATKRFPCLAPVYLPYFLATLADVPYDWSPTASLSPPPLAEFFARVRTAAFGSGDSGAAAGTLAAAAAPAPLSEIVRDGRVLGACHTINKALNFWRLISRSPTWLVATLAALLAARNHNASVPQKALGDLLLTFAGRFLHPPAMSYADGGGVDGGVYGDLVRSLVEVARPGAMARRGATFRYTIIANVMLTLMLPHRYGPLPPSSGGSANVSDYGGAGSADLEVAGLLLRHMLGLLVGSDAPQLRQMGLSGTFLPLCAVEEYGAPLPQLVDVLRETIASSSAASASAVTTGPELLPAADAAAGSGGGVGDWGSRFIQALIHNHTELDSAEAMKDKRGAGLLALQQRVLNMTFEELAGGLASLPLERLARWPNDGLATPTAITEGLFVVRHARLVQLLAAAAPEEMLSALRGPLEALTGPSNLTAVGGDGGDKADIATAAEVLAGLIASGAPWVAADGGTAGGAASGDGVGGGWALVALARAIRGTNLDMSETWALSYRYAVRGLLDGLVPERLHASAPPAADRPLPPRPPLAFGHTADTLAAALGDLLCLTVPSPLSPPPPTATAALLAEEADVVDFSAGVTAAAASGAGGGMPARIKRLRCVGAVVRELASLDPGRELPRPVRLFWGTLLDELYSVSSSLDCLSLRDQLRGPITDTLAYFGATTDGALLQALARHQQRRRQGSGGNGPGRSIGGGGGNGGGSTMNGSNGEGELVHVSAEPSGVSTPAEVEVEVELEGGGGSSGGADVVMLLVRPGGPQQPRHHCSLHDLRSRARNLALMLAARFNDAAVQVQDARVAEATTTTAPTPPPATPRIGPGGAGVADASDSPPSRAATDDLVLVDAVDVVSVPASASASETTSPGGAAAAATTSGLATTAAAMDVDAAAATAVESSSAAAVAYLGLGLEVQLDAAARHRSPRLRELVVGMLPGLLRLQDVAGPELQKFAREFHATFLVARGLSLNTHADAGVTCAAVSSAGGGGGGSGAAMLAAVLDALSAAALVEVPWSARAAALSYAQTLWFRHAPLLSPEQLRNLQVVVAARLQDAKAEVRSLAAATLSGLLRGTAPEDVEALRNGLLEKAAVLFGGGGGSRRRRRGGGGEAGASTAASAGSSPQQLQLEKLGCVAGLSALLMSYPYDVPAWLPPVLMALVRAAGGAERDGTIRGEAGRALGEFRRTHEAEALEELRARMDPNDWDSFTQATGTASYFV